MRNSDATKKIIIIMVAIAVIIVGFVFFSGRGTRRSVPNLPEPAQTEADGSTAFETAGYNVTVNYEYAYDIKALVVSAHDYAPYNIANKLSPRDFALAWGDVAATNKEVDYNWSQSGRWYSWHVKSYDDIAPIGGENGVNSQSANTHIIPATDIIKDEVKNVKVGDCLHMKGYLVNIYATKPGEVFTWNSSTTRYDTGDGACEVFYVTEIEWLP